MRLFKIEKMVGTTKLQGDGVEFSNGKVIVNWKGDIDSFVFYDSIQDMHKVGFCEEKTVFDGVAPVASVAAPPVNTPLQLPYYSYNVVPSVLSSMVTITQTPVFPSYTYTSGHQ